MIAITLCAFGCSESVQPAAEAEAIQGAKKKAEKSKIVTIPVHGKVTTIPDITKPFLTCLPVDFNVKVPREGTCTGHSVMTGVFVQEESSFKTNLCRVELSEEGIPVIYAESDVVITGNRGDKKSITSYMRINVVNFVVTGYNEVTGGTGRFEGASGEINIVDGRFDPETGQVSWKEEGYLEVQVGY